MVLVQCALRNSDAVRKMEKQRNLAVEQNDVISQFKGAEPVDWCVCKSDFEKPHHILYMG